MTIQKQSSESNDVFFFEWNGGLSYLTYLKKKTVATLTNQNMSISYENLILGIIPSRRKKEELPIGTITSISIGLKINYFDLVSASLFLIISLLTMSFWPLLLTVLFLLLTFNTSIYISDSFGKKIYIPTKDKNVAISFVNRIAYVFNQLKGTHNSLEPVVQLVPTIRNNKLKHTIQIFGACIVALVIFIIAIFSRGEFHNNYIQWVRESNIPGFNQTMNSVLENKDQFSNIEWKQVSKNGNDSDINKYVMYRATYTEDDVSVNVQTIFQVYAKDQFDPVEFTIDGSDYEIPNWNLFLIDTMDKQKHNQNSEYVKESVASTVPTDSFKEADLSDIKTTPVEVSSTATESIEISLMNFLIWDNTDAEKELKLNLDGEKASIIVGNDNPNGINLRLFVESMQSAWKLDLPHNESEPFDEYGDLSEGFSLYLKEHDFDEDGTPEILVAVSNQIDQTYLWAFSYNFMALENGSNPLVLVLNVEGQDDIVVKRNSIEIPYGSQGLFDEYIYQDGIFKQ